MKKIFGFGAFAAGLVIAVILLVMVTTEPNKNVTLESVSVRPVESGGKELFGVFRNNSDQSFSQVHVEVVFLNPSGTELSRTIQAQLQFEPEQIWEITVPVTDNAMKYRIRNLTCKPSPESTDEEIQGLCFLNHKGQVKSKR